MIYLLIVNSSLIISFVLYKLIFRRLTFFQLNRIYLIGMALFSLLAPIGIFIELPNLETVEYEIPHVDLNTYVDIAIGGPQEQPIYLIYILTCVYWIGVAISGGFFIWKGISLVKTLAQKHDYLSFSFFDKVFIGEAIKNKSTIESHERVHVDQRHSYDLLLIELLKIFNWFNPILYFFQQELKFQHECIADEICSTDRVAYAEMLVAHALQVDQLPLTHEFSNHSFLKKRIMMLFKNKSASKCKLLYVSILPMILVVLASTMIFNTSRAKGMVLAVESGVKQVAAFDHQSYPPKQTKRSHLQSNEQSDTMSFDRVEVKPVPEGGMQSFMIWVGNNFQFPKEAVEHNVSGMIEVNFIVEIDGSLSHINVKKDIGYGTKEATMKLMESAKRWKPALVGGKPVRVAYTLPIRLNVAK